MADPLVVVGGSIAALVAADHTSTRGREVRLLIPGGRVGSGFVPIERDGRRLDLGPRIIELGYDGPVAEPPPLSAYRAGPHGHRPFLGLIDDLVRSLAGDDLRPIEPPRVCRRGVDVVDFVIGGDLVGLPALLTDEERTAIAVEATEIAERLGSSGLLEHGGLADLTLAEASRTTHGATFHDVVIGPLATKATTGGADAVIAALHRKIWLPLLWPQSIAEACTGLLQYRPVRPMHTVARGGMGALVQRLQERLTAREGVTVETVGTVVSVEAAGGTTAVGFADGRSVSAADVVLAVGADDAFRIAGQSGRAERTRSVFVWLDLDHSVEAVPSVLFVLDPDLPVLRVSENTGDQAPGRRTVVCELAPSVADDDAPALAQQVVEALGLVGPRQGRKATVVAHLAGPSFASPSFSNRARHEEGLAALARAALPADVVGVEAFGADTFNEQVVQGLAAAERWS